MRKQPAFYTYTTRHALGTAGETAIADALRATGYEVDPSHPRKCGDLKVIDKTTGEIIFVEVKTSRPNSRKRFCFTLYKHWQGRECADHRGADFVVLLCVLHSGAHVVFVIPADELKFQKSIEIQKDPRGYAGKYSAFRQDMKKLRLA